MMVSPGSYIEEWKGKPYLDLIRERDRLIRYRCCELSGKHGGGQV